MTKSAAVWESSLAAARAHIISQGEVIYAYNLLQDRFFNIFLLAIALERPEKPSPGIRFYSHALAMWHVLQSDNQQRKLALAALSSIPTSLNLKPGLKRLEWARVKADKLAEYRNLLAHNTIMFRGQFKGKKVVMAPQFGGNSTRPAHRKKLDAIKGHRFWRTLCIDILNLSDYVEFCGRHIYGLDYQRRNVQVIGMQKTWPGRPRLKSLRQGRKSASSRPQ
jgi:hypothetical protein